MKESRLTEQWIERSREQLKVEKELEDSLLKQTHLTLNEYYVLYFLSNTPNKKIRLNELEKKMNLSQSALSRMIKRLEDKDCQVIERCTCTQDKRGIYLYLTAIGQNKFEQSYVIVDSILNKYL